ncbi:MAG: response regulator [Spirochaetaceae bacterium]|jgi:putative two-component system response regulator|nr:response regulator [Spirochaetaceae bacterium]
MKNGRQVIFLVDDNMANLTAGKTMLREYYDIFSMPSGAKLFELLKKITPDLILLDIEMPEMNGYEALEKLKADKNTRDIPVIFLTARNDPGSELQGLNLGAIDYISKPFSPPLLLKRIENHLLIRQQQTALQDYNDNLQQMVQTRTRQVVALQNSVLSAVTEMVEFRDDVTGGHIERTQSYLKLLVDKLLAEKIYWEEVSAWNLEFLIPSAQLHDVGKIAISDAILNKPGKLTAEEFGIMKTHAAIGESAIEGIMKTNADNDFLHHAKLFAGTHHEKWDGSGYPRGLRNSIIPLQGRLMAIADVYDALIAVRPYKQPLSTQEAERIIIEGRETHFDPVLVDLFRELAPQFALVAEHCNAALQNKLKPKASADSLKETA